MIVVMVNHDKLVIHIVYKTTKEKQINIFPILEHEE
jgi:hypothetical protein